MESCDLSNRACTPCRGYKPDPPASGTIPDLPLYTTAYKDHVCLYADMSGDSLHRRGYRAAMHRASLNEAAAAGILSLAGWSLEAAQSGEYSRGP